MWCFLLIYQAMMILGILGYAEVSGLPFDKKLWLYFISSFFITITFLNINIFNANLYVMDTDDVTQRDSINSSESEGGLGFSKDEYEYEAVAIHSLAYYAWCISLGVLILVLIRTFGKEMNNYQMFGLYLSAFDVIYGGGFATLSVLSGGTDKLNALKDDNIIVEFLYWIQTTFKISLIFLFHS